MDDLLQQGIIAYKVGKRDEARKIFITVVEQNPDDERAWQWMYNVCNTDQGRIHCLKQILRINPNNKKANQLFKQFPTSKPKSRSGKLGNRAAIFIGIALVCIIGVYAVSLIFTDNDLVVSNSTQEAPIPVEKAIEMTFSAAGAQTAASYSSTPIPTLTLASPMENIPTATVFIFQLQTDVAQPTEYIYSTNTPFSLATQPLSTPQPTIPPQSAVCSCSGGLDCKDFSTHNQAQACFEYCRSLGLGDVHGLDGNDQDGLACESLP